jgi:hypothetical protein
MSRSEADRSSGETAQGLVDHGLVRAHDEITNGLSGH